MSNTLTRPRTVVAILAAGALIAVGVLLLAGVFASDDATKTTTVNVAANSEAYRGYQGIPVPGTPITSGAQQALDQANERRLQHGAPALVAPKVSQQTGGLTYPGKVGDTKNDLPAASPAAGRFLATPAKPAGDTKNDLPCGSSLSNRCVSERAPGAGH